MTHISPRGSEGTARPAARHKHAHDTAEGCDALAAADRVRATGMGTAQSRGKLEHSAASWAARGEMLRRLDVKFEARLRRTAS